MDMGESIIASENGSNRDHVMTNNLVRVLLCDTDVESCREVLALLNKCCYQVTPVYSAADALDALNSHGHCIDIILAAPPFLSPMASRFSISSIPVINEDDIPLVLKGLMLGATDYLLKPLS